MAEAGRAEERPVLRSSDSVILGIKLLSSSNEASLLFEFDLADTDREDIPATDSCRSMLEEEGMFFSFFCSFLCSDFIELNSSFDFLRLSSR